MIVGPIGPSDALIWVGIILSLPRSCSSYCASRARGEDGSTETYAFSSGSYAALGSWNVSGMPAVSSACTLSSIPVVIWKSSAVGVGRVSVFLSEAPASKPLIWTFVFDVLVWLSLRLLAVGSSASLYEASESNPNSTLGIADRVIELSHERGMKIQEIVSKQAGRGSPLNTRGG